MGNTIESYFYRNRIKKIIESCGFKSERIETGTTLNGFPDIYARTKKIEFHAEAKISLGLTKDYTVKPKWRAGQLGWAGLHINLNLIWFLIIRVEGIGDFFTDKPKKEYRVEELITFTRRNFLLYFKQLALTRSEEDHQRTGP